VFSAAKDLSAGDVADQAELRNIEMLVNARTAVEGITPEEQDVLAKISEILYSTDVSPFPPHIQLGCKGQVELISSGRL